MPAQVPDEVIPHILKARYDMPTAPGPLVWVYPFDEYHDWAYTQQDRLPEIYYGDWLIRQAINNGFPLNTIVSTTSFQSATKQKPALFNESVLVSIVPPEGSSLEDALISHVKNGGKLLIYGPSTHVGKEFSGFLNLQNNKALEGEFSISSVINPDRLETSFPRKILHSSLFSGGGISSNLANKADAGTKILATMQQPGNSRDVAWVRRLAEWNGGAVAYVRGTNSSSFKGGKLLTPDDPQKWFTGPLLLRYALNEFGISYSIDKRDPAIKSPVLTIGRSNNGFFFSGYSPNTTVRQRFKFPQGAPVLTGFEATLDKGNSTYSFPTAWHKECRIFVSQQDGIISCKEAYSGQREISRRLHLTGLKNATVRIYPEERITDGQLQVFLNSAYPWQKGRQDYKLGDKKLGYHFVVENVTGELGVAW